LGNKFASSLSWICDMQGLVLPRHYVVNPESTPTSDLFRYRPATPGPISENIGLPSRRVRLYNNIYLFSCCTRDCSQPASPFICHIILFLLVSLFLRYLRFNIFSSNPTPRCECYCTLYSLTVKDPTLTCMRLPLNRAVTPFSC
jgi:hypothetical protein